MGDVDLGNWPGNGATGDVTSQPAAVPDLQAVQLVMGAVVAPRAAKPRASDPRFVPGQENAVLRNDKNKAEQMVLLQAREIRAMKTAASASVALIVQLQQQEHGGDGGFGGSGQDEDEEVLVALWLPDVHLSFAELYAEAMAEYGYGDTGCLRGATEEELADCFVALDVKVPHQRMIRRAVAELAQL
jgi:hypothetical protein